MWSQKFLWKNGNKNELNILINLDEYGKVKWTDHFTWCEVPAFNREVRDYLKKHKGKYLDFNELSNNLKTIIQSKWKRKQFKDFDYIETTLPTAHYVWCLVIVAIICGLINFIAAAHANHSVYV